MKKHNDNFKTFEDGLKAWNIRYNVIEKKLSESCHGGSLKFHSKEGIPYRLISDIDGFRALGMLFSNIEVGKDYTKVLDYVGMKIGVNFISKNTVEVILTCKSSEHSKFYIQLFYDLITDLELIKDTKERYIELFNWIKKKASLFEELNSEKLSISKEKGLYGELETIEYIKKNTPMDLATIIAGWGGCHSKPIDFDFEKVAVETKIISGDEVTFHGLYQTSFTKETYLQAFALKENLEYGESLKEKIDRLKSYMDLDLVALFEKSLRAYGYFNNLATSGKKFKVTAVKLYDMTNGYFPKYKIDPEFSKIKLSLNLKSVERCKLPYETLANYIILNEDIH